MIENDTQPQYPNKTLSDFDVEHNYDLRNSIYISPNYENNLKNLDVAGSKDIDESNMKDIEIKNEVAIEGLALNQAHEITSHEITSAAKSILCIESIHQNGSYHNFLTNGDDYEDKDDSKDLMMSNLENETNFTCYTCKKLYTNPRILSCLHTFCQDCIEKMIIKNCPFTNKFINLGNDSTDESISNIVPDKSYFSKPYINTLTDDFGNISSYTGINDKYNIAIICPICHHKTQFGCDKLENIKADIMNKFPINYHIHDSLILLNLKEKIHFMVTTKKLYEGESQNSTTNGDLKDLDTDRNDIFCNSCKSPTLSSSPDKFAVARCLDCASYLCKVCVQAHQFMRCFENHCVMSFEEIYETLQDFDDNTGRNLGNIGKIVDQDCIEGDVSSGSSSSGSSPGPSSMDSDKTSTKERGVNGTKRNLIQSLHYVVKCQNHPLINVKYFCSYCQVLACNMCQDMHQLSPHVCHPLDKMLESNERAKISQDILAVKANVPLLESKITQYQNKLTSLENQQEAIKYRLKDTQEACKDLIDSYFNKVLDALSDKHSEYELKVMEAYHNAEKLFESFEDSTKFVEGLLEHSNLPEILSLKPLIKSRLHSLSQSILPFHVDASCAISKLELALPFGMDDMETFLKTKLLDAFLKQHDESISAATFSDTHKTLSVRVGDDNNMIEMNGQSSSKSQEISSLVATKELNGEEEVLYQPITLGETVIPKNIYSGHNSNDKALTKTAPSTNPLNTDLAPLGNINPSSALANNIMGLAALAKLGNIGLDNNLLMTDMGLLTHSIDSGNQNSMSNQLNNLDVLAKQQHLTTNNPLPNGVAARYMNGMLLPNVQGANKYGSFLQNSEMTKTASSLLSNNAAPDSLFTQDLQHQSNLASNLSRLLTLSTSSASSLLPTPMPSNHLQSNDNCNSLININHHHHHQMGNFKNASMGGGGGLHSMEHSTAIMPTLNNNGPSGFNSCKDFHSLHSAALSAALHEHQQPYSFSMQQQALPQAPNSLSLMSSPTNNGIHPSPQGYNLMNPGTSNSQLSVQSSMDPSMLSPSLYMNSPPPPFGMNYVPPMRSGEVNKMSIMKVRVKFGSLGPGNLQFNSPHGFCLGMDEEIIVADTNNHRIQVYSKTGAFKGQFGIPGRDEGQLWYPRKVAVNKINGKFIVCDRGNERSRMQIFDRNGNFLKKVPIRYIDIVAGLAITEVGSPGGAGHIVAVDSVSPTVFRIAETGDLLHWFDCSEYMREPSDVAVRADEYYVCDFKGHCVAVFAENGQFLRRIGRESLTNFPNGIDVSEGGEVLVGDSHGNRFHVAVFRGSDGAFLAEFECPHVKVSRCCGLKITSEGYVVTLAKNNHYVLVLDTLFVPP